MKKVNMLFVTAVAALALAGCSNKGGSTTSSAPASSSQPSSSQPSSSQPSSSQPAPSKTAWTKEEKDLMETYLFYSLPFAHGLTYSEELSEEALVFVGDKDVSEEKLGEYGAIFEGEGYDFIQEYVEYDEQGNPIKLSDVYDVAPFDEEFEPLIYRINCQNEGYIPVYGQIVAVGYDDEGMMMVVSTQWGAALDSQFSVDYLAYDASEGALSSIYYMATLGAVYISADSEATEEELDDAIALFGEFESSSATMCGFDDMQYEFPFTYGNALSESFVACSQMYVVDAEESDLTSYRGSLTDIGYTEKSSTSSGITFYTLSYASALTIAGEEVYAVYNVSCAFFPEFFGQGHDGIYVSYAFAFISVE